MKARGALLALLAWGGVARAQTALHIELRDAGPGIGPRILANAISHPYDVAPPSATRFVVPRGTTSPRTLIVLGRDVAIEGTVRGDVIVVAGDLYMHPGGRISGSAIAIGGGVYRSRLAEIGARVESFRDFTYDIVPTDGGFALSYRAVGQPGPSTLAWVGALGLALPTYDRSNGLSFGVAPPLAVPDTRIVLEPRVTYRSQLGRVDPSITVDDSVTERTTVRLEAGRTTASNDEWIRPDLVNSVHFFAVGDDARNYYRATRGELSVEHRWNSVNGSLIAHVGAQAERAYSVRPGDSATSAPWTLFDRGGHDDALRPNPNIDPGNTGSFVGGLEWSWASQGMTVDTRLDEELGAFDPDCSTCALNSYQRFAQTTVDGRVSFPTFGAQTFQVHAHAVVSSNGAIPRQRWAYLGGPGTIPTLELLELGGDHLLYFDARYATPLSMLSLPFVGPPTLALREVIGGADVGGFGSLRQAIGPRLSLGFFYGEFLVDPVHHISTLEFGIGLTP